MPTESEKTTNARLPIPGQFSLRALFIATLVSAVVFAVLVPFVRGWPTDFQLHFVRVAAACVVLPAALYAWQAWHQQKLERASGELLAYFPGKSARMAAICGIAIYLLGFAIWVWRLNFSASQGRELPDAWNLVVLGAFLNSSSLWAYGAHGIQLRDRGLIFQSVRFDWREINRFTWPNDGKLVLYLASRTVFAMPVSPGAPNHRASAAHENGAIIRFAYVDCMTVRIGGSRFDQSAILNGMRLLAFDFAIRGNSDWMPRAHRQVRDQLGDRAGEWLAVFDRAFRRRVFHPILHIHLASRSVSGRLNGMALIGMELSGS